MHFLGKFSPENELPEQRNFELINITKIQILKIFYHLPYCKFLEKWYMFSLLYEEYMYFIFIFFCEIFYFSVINRDIFFKSIRPKLSDIYHKTVRILGVTGFYFGPKVYCQNLFFLFIVLKFFHKVLVNCRSHTNCFSER